MEISRDAAGEALVSGSKTVETVQAFLLLAVYPVPKKKWLDDRSWLYMGTAIRYIYPPECQSPRIDPISMSGQACTGAAARPDARRAGRTGELERHPHLDELLLRGRLARDAVWQDGDGQARRLSRPQNSARVVQVAEQRPVRHRPLWLCRAAAVDGAVQEGMWREWSRL